MPLFYDGVSTRVCLFFRECLRLCTHMPPAGHGHGHRHACPGSLSSCIAAVLLLCNCCTVAALPLYCCSTFHWRPQRGWCTAGAPMTTSPLAWAATTRCRQVASPDLKSHFHCVRTSGSSTFRICTVGTCDVLNMRGTVQFVHLCAPCLQGTSVLLCDVTDVVRAILKVEVLNTASTAACMPSMVLDALGAGTPQTMTITHKDNRHEHIMDKIHVHI